MLPGMAFLNFCATLSVFSTLDVLDVIQPHPSASALQNIDTDQIIPAEYLTLVPSKVCIQHSTLQSTSPKACVRTSNFEFSLTVDLLSLYVQPDEYEKLGSYALIGLPDELYPTRCVQRLCRSQHSQ